MVDLTAGKKVDRLAECWAPLSAETMVEHLAEKKAASKVVYLAEHWDAQMAV